MLSRLAANFYWMNRYLERAEGTARLIGSTTHLALDQADHLHVSWRSLVDILGAWPWLPSGHPSEQEDAVIQFLLADRSFSGSVRSATALAFDNARSVRDRLPGDVFESLNRARMYVNDEAERAIRRRQRQLFVERTVQHINECTGFLDGGMARNDAWHFVVLGRFLERADMGTRIIDARAASLQPRVRTVPDAWDDLGWMTLLRGMGGYTQFRQSRGPRIQGAATVSYLIQSEHFPRSVYFSLRRVQEALRALPGGDAALEAAAEALKTTQEPVSEPLDFRALHHWMDRVQRRISDVHQQLTDTWLTPVSTP